MINRLAFGACALWMPFAALAAPCPQLEPGATYPWQINDFMAGDLYAHMFIDIDEAGRPFKCAMGKTNILHDDRFLACKAFLDDWHTDPIMRDGKAVRGTVQRYLTMAGSKHLKANSDARIRWFKEHPAERPRCYPE
jgi:hypothetical protein